MRLKNIKKIRGKNTVDTSYGLNVGFLIYYAYHIPLRIIVPPRRQQFENRPRNMLYKFLIKIKRQKLVFPR